MVRNKVCVGHALGIAFGITVLIILSVNINSVAAYPSYPSGPYPSDGTTDQQVNLSLNWNGGGNGSQYQVDMYNDTNPARKTICTGVSPNFCSIEGLSYNTTYYWAVTLSYSEYNQSGYWKQNGVWVNSGYWNNYSVFVPSGYCNYDFLGNCNWVDTSHYQYYNQWVDTSHWEPTWVDTSHWETRYIYGPTWNFTTRSEKPPNTPDVPSPSNGAIYQPINPTLNWSGGDPDGDPVTYTVYLDDNPNPTLQKCLGSSTSCSVSGLNYYTTYYWKVVSSDGIASPVSGPVWSFTVQAPSAQSSPTIVNLQGKLTNSTNGNPVQTGSIRVTIKDLSGTQIWQDTFNNALDAGVFNIPLGAANELKLVPDTVYQMIVEIDAHNTVFSTADVTFGDNNPVGDVIKFKA